MIRAEMPQKNIIFFDFRLLVISMELSQSEYKEERYACYWPSVLSRWLDVGQVPSYFACLWTETESEVHKLAKKERGQYPAILPEQAWSIKDLLYGFRGNFSCGTRRVVPSGQDSSILPARNNIAHLAIHLHLHLAHLVAIILIITVIGNALCTVLTRKTWAWCL